jgi:hypothetical protein
VGGHGSVQSVVAWRGVEYAASICDNEETVVGMVHSKWTV